MKRHAFSVVVGGDIHVDRPDPSGVFEYVAECTADDEMVLANLEAMLAPEEVTPNRFKVGDGAVCLRSSMSLVSELSAFTCLSLANNHSMDVGEDAFLNTIEELRRINVGIVGGGGNRAMADAPFLTKTQTGESVGVLALSCLYQKGYEAADTLPGISALRVRTAYEPPSRVHDQPGLAPIVHTTCDPVELAALCRRIRALRSQVDFLVVSVHWGVSGGNQAIVEYQRELAYACVTAGADFVFGHHSHLVAPVEIYQGKLICYGLGDLVFDQPLSYAEAESVLVRAYVESGQIVRVSFVVVSQDERRNLVPAEPESSAEVVRRMTFVEPSLRQIEAVGNEVLFEVVESDKQRRVQA